MVDMIADSGLTDLMFIHGTSRDYAQVRLLADDRNSFTDLHTISQENFNVV